MPKWVTQLQLNPAGGSSVPKPMGRADTFENGHVRLRRDVNRGLFCDDALWKSRKMAQP